MAAWLQELSGLRVTASDEAELQAQLKSGVVLCQAANRMGAGIICGISQDDEMENIEKFVKFLQPGVVDCNKKLFVATDLHANKNMEQVMITLNDLGEALHAYPGYSEGPTVGRPVRMRMLSSNPDLQSHVKPSVYFKVLAL